MAPKANNDTKQHMKLFPDIRSARRWAVPVAAAALLASSCSMIHEDLPECATRPATRASVNFIYDYNTLSQDLFNDNVGSVTLYVYDADNHLVSLSEFTADQFRADGFAVPLSLPYGTYSLYASARASEEGYEASLLTPGAKFRRSAANQGDAFDALLYTLDNTNGAVDHASQPLEHMWLSQQPATLTLTEADMPAEGAPQPDDVIVPATVPLQRVTNNLHLSITRSNSATANIPALSASDYEISVQTVSGRHELNLLAQPTAAAQPLLYTPYKVTNGTRATSTIEADIAMSRLMLEDDAAKHTRLIIRSRLSGESWEWDLPALLARGREAYPAEEWNDQEYLDREYDYNLAVDFSESDEGWRYIEVQIPILNWAKRIQHVDL